MKCSYFDDNFLENLSSDDDEAIIQLHDHYRNMRKDHDGDRNFNRDFLEASIILEQLVEARNLPIQIPTISPFQNNKEQLATALRDARLKAQERITQQDQRDFFESKKNKYSAKFSNRDVYEFSDEEYDRIQALISEIRTEINTAVLIPSKHKQRLLKRLEAMQMELHKQTSDIDRFWGFIAEAGIVARKFGEDLDPLTNNIYTLGKIVIGVIMSKEGIHALPDIVNLLQIDSK